MKEILKESLGFEVPVNVYESVAEADAAAGKEGAVLEQAVANLYYRGAAPEVRAAICERIESVTGIKRAVKPVMTTQKQADGTEVEVQKKDSDGNEMWAFDQKEGDYIDFARAKWEKDNPGKNFTAEFTADIQSYIRSLNDGKGVSIDIKERERKAPQPKKLPTRYLETAQKMLAPEGKIDQFAKDYRKLFDKEVDRTSAETVGWALKELVEENAKRQSGKYA